MKFQMAENSLFAILLRKPWWVSIATAAALVALARFVLPPQWFIFGATLALPFIGIGAVTGWRQLQKPIGARVAGTLEAVRAMAWPEFATTIETAWRRDGSSIERIDDPAADFEVANGWRRGIVACKRWKAGRTGVEPLRELHAARERREVHDCIYVSTGEFTDQALKFAADNRINLMRGPELAILLPELARGAKPALRRSAG